MLSLGLGVVLTTLSIVPVICDGAFPHGLEAMLQNIAAAKSAQFNCSVSIAVYQNGSSIAVAAGTTDFASGRKARTSDRYAWGSGTKPLTGASILRLVSEGAFGLDDLVAPLVDPFLRKMAAADPSQNFTSMADLWGANASNVTVFQLITMANGPPDFDTAEYYITGSYDDRFRAMVYANTAKSWSPAELMSLPWVAGHWKPGYSTTNFMLLGLIVAAHTGASSWRDFSQGVFLPLGLKSRLHFGVTGAPADLDVVPGYDRTSYNAYPRKAYKDVVDVGGVFAGWTGADMVGTPLVVAELAWNIYGPEPTIAPKQFASLMNNPKGFYGVATFNLDRQTAQNNKYGRAWGHLGVTYGYQSILAFLPAFNITMAIATNLETDTQEQPGDAFCEAYAALGGALLGKEVHCDAGCNCTQLAPPPPRGSCCWGIASCSKASVTSCPDTFQDHVCHEAEATCSGSCHGFWCPTSEFVI